MNAPRLKITEVAMSPSYKLFEPAQIAGLKLRNRLVMPPMATNYEKDGLVTGRQRAYYAARACLNWQKTFIGMEPGRLCSFITPEPRRPGRPRGCSPLALRS